MKDDDLITTLIAVQDGQRVEPRHSDITLISYGELNLADATRIRRFQEAVRRELGIPLRVVGGSPGCTKLEFVIEIADPVERDLAIKAILASEIFRKEARSVEFVRLVVREPYEQQSLVTGETEGFIDRMEAWRRSRGADERGNTIIIAPKAKEVHMSNDQYNVEQAGAVGPGSTAQNFQQIWNNWQTSEANVDLALLAQDLEKLRLEMKREGTSPEQDVATGEVAGAQTAAKNGDGGKVLEKLAKAGKWALSMAEKIGAGLAVAALKKAIGL